MDAGTDDPTGQPMNVRVQAELERMILAGELPPGERLNEIVLSQQLGVSRGPIREAARALERLGLVTVIMNRGAFVRSLSLKEVGELYDLWTVVNAYAAARVAHFCCPDQLVALNRLVVEMEDIEAADRTDRWFALNDAFHDSIVAFADNAALRAVHEDCNKRIMLLRRSTFERAGNTTEATREHRQIVNAILAGDSVLARERGEAHGRSGRARFFSSVHADTMHPAIETE